MNKIILNQALVKLNELLKKYNGFNTIFLDNWRGYRFIYDIEKDCNCKNGCLKCPLYCLLKDEQEKNGFTAGLYIASPEDKDLFGSQKFLNIKSFEEYQNCYINFLLKKCKTTKEICDEISLIKGVKILYSKKSSAKTQEQEFKSGIKNAIQNIPMNGIKPISLQDW